MPWGFRSSNAGDERFVLLLGLVLSIGGLLTLPFRALGPIGGAFLYLGVVTVALATALAVLQSGWQRTLWAYAPVLALVSLLYVWFAFSGFGRIVIAELALACLVAASSALPRRWHKTLMLVALVPGLVGAAAIGFARGGSEGLTFEEIRQYQLSVESIGESGGLGSAFAPILEPAILVDLEDSRARPIPLMYGLSARDLLLAPVPRALWPSKPVQLGASIVEVRQPYLAGSGFSIAVGLWGEGYINFRIPGMVALTSFVAWLVSLSDSIMPRIWGSWSPRAAALATVGFASTVSSIPDLVWGGFGTFASRGVTRLLVLLIVAWLVLRVLPDRKRTVLDARREPLLVPLQDRAADTR